MNKPDDVRQEDWEKAEDVFYTHEIGPTGAISAIARAIMAARLQEREECSSLLEERSKAWREDGSEQANIIAAVLDNCIQTIRNR